MIGFNVTQFRDLIDRTLQTADARLSSPSAVELLLGTAAQESRLGYYLKQVRGPALGAFQIEPATFLWLTEKYKGRYPTLVNRTADELEWDLQLGIIVCRLRYWVVPHPLPSAYDLPALAQYWKDHYNTHLGAGTPEEWLKSYGDLVSGR